jgi:hypothetical protein
MNGIIEFFESLEFEGFLGLFNTTAFVGIGTWLSSKFVQLSKFKATAPTEIKTELMAKLPSEIDASVNKSIKANLDKHFATLDAKIGKIEDGQRIIAESLLLASSGDSASKLALVENISKINNINNDIVESVKEEIHEEIKHEETLHKEKVELLEEIAEELGEEETTL